MKSTTPSNSNDNVDNVDIVATSTTSTTDSSSGSLVGTFSQGVFLLDSIQKKNEQQQQKSSTANTSSLLSLSTKQKQNNDTPTTVTVSDMTRRMVCGGLAGMIAKTVTNPLERIKMLSQTGDYLRHTATTSTSSSSSSSSNSIWTIYKTIIEKEGIIGLWAGNGANLIRVFPAKAVVFSTNDLYRSIMIQIHTTVSSSQNQNQQQQQHQHQHQHQNQNQQLPAGYSFIAGGLAGMSASMVTYPLDFARGRISGKIAIAKGDKVYTGIIQTCMLTIKDEGFFALYKGITPTIIGAMPYEGIKFGTVAILEQLNLFNNNEYDDNADATSTVVSKKSKPLQKMFYGSCGGIMAGLITYPNDTVRRLLQIQGSRSGSNTGNSTNGTQQQLQIQIQPKQQQLYTGYWDCVQKTYKQDGIKRFYRGAAVNIVRMAPNTAIQFGSYELLKQWSTDLF